MAGQTENERARLVYGSVTEHEGFTRMLFVDAIVGVGIHRAVIGLAAEQNGFADCTGDQHSENWTWRRPALEALPTVELQDLYVHLKKHEAVHAQ